MASAKRVSTSRKTPARKPRKLGPSGGQLSIQLKNYPRLENSVKYEVVVFDGACLLGFLDGHDFARSKPIRGDLTFEQARRVIMGQQANRQLRLGRTLAIIQRTITNQAAAWRLAEGVGPK